MAAFFLSSFFTTTFQHWNETNISSLLMYLIYLDVTWHNPLTQQKYLPKRLDSNFKTLNTLLKRKMFSKYKINNLWTNFITCAQSSSFTVLSNARDLCEPPVSCWKKMKNHGVGGGVDANGAEALWQSTARGTSWEYQRAWFVQRDVTSSRVHAGSQKNSWLSLDYSTDAVKIHSAENIKKNNINKPW
jgi:hypothetical protein